MSAFPCLPAGCGTKPLGRAQRSDLNRWFESLPCPPVAGISSLVSASTTFAAGSRTVCFLPSSQPGRHATGSCIEEILSIIQEARKPGEGPKVGDQFVGGSMDLDDIDADDADIDDIETSGDFVCAL